MESGLSDRQRSAWSDGVRRVGRERIQLNEDTLSSGAPRETDNPEALTALPEVRRLLFAGSPVDAYALAEKKLMGRPSRLQSYQTLGDLRLAVDHQGAIADYRRELDLGTAVARVSHRVTSGGAAIRFVSDSDEAAVTLESGRVYEVTFSR